MAGLPAYIEDGSNNGYIVGNYDGLNNGALDGFLVGLLDSLEDG